MSNLYNLYYKCICVWLMVGIMGGAAKVLGNPVTIDPQPNEPRSVIGTDCPNIGLDSDGDGVPNSVDLDDDNDGIPDAIELQGNDSFCPAGFFQVISGQLKILDITTGNYLDIGPKAGFSYNAMAFNPDDGLLYAISTGKGKDQYDVEVGKGDIITIDPSSGWVTRIRATPSTNKGAITGDIYDGIFYFTHSNSNVGIYRYNLSTGELTSYANASNWSPADWVVKEGVAYGLGKYGEGVVLHTMDLMVGEPVLSTLKIPFDTTFKLAFGAAYIANDEDIFFSSNDGGLYQMLGYDTDTPEFIYIGPTEPTNNNDGASCSNSFYNHVDTDGDGIADYLDLDSDNDGIPDAVEACGDYTLVLENCMRDADGNAAYRMENGCSTGLVSAACLSAPIDSDGDGTFDFLDLDSDNDGCTDAVEAGTDWATGVNQETFAGATVATDEWGRVLEGGNAVCHYPPNSIWREQEFDGCTTMSVGNRIWIDDGRDDNPADNDTNMGVPNNSVLDGDETGLGGVKVYLFPVDTGGNIIDVNRDGIIGGIADVIDSTETDGEGYYLIEGFTPGRYKLCIPPQNFRAGGSLETYVSSMSVEYDPDQDNLDNRDNGIDEPNLPQNGVLSALITLTSGGEPAAGATLDTERDFHPALRHGRQSEDANSNLTVDFAFVCPLYQCAITDFYEVAKQGDIDIGKTHGMWLNFIDYGSLNPTGKASGDLGAYTPYFNWESGATLSMDNQNQLVYIEGTVRHTDDPNVAFEVYIKLFNCLNWDAYTAAGYTFQDGYGGLPDPKPTPGYEEWMYFAMEGTLTAIAPGKDFDGETFTIENENYEKQAQFGRAANDKDGDLGLSGWYDVTRDSNGEVYRGDGNFDVSTCLAGGCNTPVSVVQPMVVIEGAYAESSALMETRLQGSIPVVGPDGTLSENALLNGPESDIVDWVEVSLLDATTRETVEKRSALLRSDGGVVEVDARSPLTFSTASGSYFVMIEHRNHLNIVTEEPVDLKEGRVNQLKFDGPMICGDSNGDGIINTHDRAAIWNSRNQRGYLPEDINLDGVVDEKDRAAAWQNRNNLK